MAFDGLLRPGELYLVEARDINFYPNKAVVTLRDTKTGKRKGAGEMVVLNSLHAKFWLRKACALRRYNDPILLDGAPSFRLLFKNPVQHFELQGLYAVYSLRRGGATPSSSEHGAHAPPRPLVQHLLCSHLSPRYCRYRCKLGLESCPKSTCKVGRGSPGSKIKLAALPERGPW